MSTTGRYSLIWENGVTISGRLYYSTRTAALQAMDTIYREAAYPTSIHAVIALDNVPVWAQHGTTVTLNR